jgi:aldehyde dehydrogenase (NAD+)
VEAARKIQPKWAATAEHGRAQILYYIAENLDARAAEFADRLRLLKGIKSAKTRLEVDAAVARLFAWGAWADKHEGAVHKPPFRGLALAMNEPVGVVGIVLPEEPGLLAFVSLVGAAIAAGNAVVAVPSMAQALIATDLYQVLDTSDVPGGVVNIVTGDKRTLGLELAKHDAVDAIWYFGNAADAADIERASAGNLKQAWTETVVRDWGDAAESGGRDLLRHATQVKNIWIPYGE